MPDAGGRVPFETPTQIAAALPRAVAHANDDGILAHPTETIYGLGTLVRDRALERLVAAKHRPDAKPFLLLIANRAMLETLGARVSRAAARLADAFWPGPLTLMLPGASSVHPLVRGARGEIAVRWTSHAGAASLVSALGEPLTSTSANVSGLPPCRDAQEIVRTWAAELARGELLVLDGGRLADASPSTMVDCTGERPRLMRAGAIGVAQLRLAAPDLAVEE